MWRSPSGKQQVGRADPPEDVTALRELPGAHTRIVADIARRVKLRTHYRAHRYPEAVPTIPHSKAGKIGLAVVAVGAVWLARTLKRRQVPTATGSFTGSADTWPPVTHAPAKGA